jgi:alkyldihydroxyacetonephosphate synthase
MDRVLVGGRELALGGARARLRLPEPTGAAGARADLAHVPQSYEWATVGGCVATRSAGQSSTHGRIDANVVGLRCATPAGELATLDAPASAAGPALRELVVGSEGVLGVITRVALRVRRVPALRPLRGWLMRSFAELRRVAELEQGRLRARRGRLSDETETRVSLALAGGGGPARRAALAGTRALGFRTPCLLVLGGRARRRRCARAGGGRTGAAAGGRAAGRPRAGRGWAAARFAGSHLRDDLLDAECWWRRWRPRRSTAGGVARGRGRARSRRRSAMPSSAATSRTSTDGRVAVLHRPRRARPGGPRRPVAPREGGRERRHRGRRDDHAPPRRRAATMRPWLEREVGGLGLEMLRTLKERCDPAGIMNPAAPPW